MIRLRIFYSERHKDYASILRWTALRQAPSAPDLGGSLTAQTAAAGVECPLGIKTPEPLLTATGNKAFAFVGKDEARNPVRGDLSDERFSFKIGNH